MLAELDAKQMNVRNTLLRISGAIQVIEEELAKQTQSPGNGGGQPAGAGEFIHQG